MIARAAVVLALCYGIIPSPLTAQRATPASVDSAPAHNTTTRDTTRGPSHRLVHALVGAAIGAVAGEVLGQLADGSTNHNAGRACGGCDHVYVSWEVLTMPVGAVIGAVVGVLRR